jgi:renalase
MQNIDTDVLVVGAGLTGLMAANALQQHRLRVTVVEKSERVGGRLATQRMGSGWADYGAQFFAARTPDFQHQAEQWLAAGIIYPWSTGWSDGSVLTAQPHGHVRYAVHGGMKALAEHLAQGVDVHLKAGLAGLTFAGNGWQVRAENGQTYRCQAILLTPPVPQTLRLLDNNQIRLTPTDRTALEQIEFAPGLVGLFHAEGQVQLPEPGMVHRVEAPVNWIADNQRKGISPKATIITVQASPDYSRKLWEASDSEILVKLQAEVQLYLAPRASFIEAQLKRWSYSLPTITHPQRHLIATDLPTLVFAGDAFGGPLVEGAALSGLAAAGTIGDKLSK